MGNCDNYDNYLSSEVAKYYEDRLPKIICECDNCREDIYEGDDCLNYDNLVVLCEHCTRELTKPIHKTDD